MTIREYLGEIKFIDMEINAMLERQRKVRDYATTISSGCVRDGGKCQSPTDKVGNAVAQIVDLERCINQQIDKMVHVKCHVMEEIAKLPKASHRIVLEKHYIDGQPWAEVCADMCYSMRRVKSFHDEALKALELIHSDDLT